MENDLWVVTEFLDLNGPGEDLTFQEDKPMNFICCLMFFEFIFLSFVTNIKKNPFRTKGKKEML